MIGGGNKTAAMQPLSEASVEGTCECPGPATAPLRQGEVETETCYHLSQENTGMCNEPLLETFSYQRPQHSKWLGNVNSISLKWCMNH